MPPLKPKATPKKEEVISISGPSTQWVSVEKKVTKRIGEYESAIISVKMQLHIDATDEDIDLAHETIKIINERIDKTLVKEVNKLINNFGD